MYRSKQGLIINRGLSAPFARGAGTVQTCPLPLPIERERTVKTLERAVARRGKFLHMRHLRFQEMTERNHWVLLLVGTGRQRKDLQSEF